MQGQKHEDMLILSNRRWWWDLSWCFVVLLSRVHCAEEDEKEIVDFLKNNNLLQGMAEIVFLLDRSGSVGAANFEIEKGFVESLLTHVVVDVNASRVAVISFSNAADCHIDYLRNPKNKCFLSEELQDVMYKNSGATNISGALDEAFEVLKKARPNVNKVVILVSDGLATHGGDPVVSAEKLKNQNVQIFTFGIGRFLMDQLKALATSPRHTYSCTKFTEFKSLSRKIRGDPHESAWAGVSTVPSCSHLCDSPYKGQPDDPGCCDFFAKCSCALLSGMHTCVCGPGYYGLSGLIGKCKECPKGTYKSSLEPASSCVECPPHSTTQDTASKSISDCHCEEGYKGNPAEGSPCAIVKCPPLQNPTNGMMFGDCEPQFGSVCHFFCDDGFELTSKLSESRTCNSSGQWSGSPAVCRTIRCPDPVPPKFGSKFCASRELTVGIACRFDCPAGYDITGSETRECLPNKMWSGIQTGCLERRCPKPPELKYGNILNCNPNEKPVVGATCLYKCRNGFMLQGSPFQICNDNKEYTDFEGRKQFPTCKDVVPPTIKCPKVLRVPTTPGQDMALVYWDLPIASDNTGETLVLETVPPGLRPPMKFFIGSSTVLYKATDNSGLSSTCNVSVMVVDNEPPKIVECPFKVERNTTEVQVAVYWKEPIFKDNSKEDVTIRKSHEPGHTFEVGRHSVIYMAIDASQNVAKCRFEVIVTQNECPYYPPPVNGAFACDDWMLGQFCQVYCDARYDFNFQPAEWYICNSRAQWQTLPEGLPVPWPDCSSLYVPHRVRSMVKGFYYHGDCNDPRVQAAIKEVFLKHFTTKFSAPMFCSGEGACTMDKVIVKCGQIQEVNDVNNVRKRRDTWQMEPEGIIEIDFEITIKADEEAVSPEELLKDLMEAIDQLSWSADDFDETLTFDVPKDSGNQEAEGKIVMTSSQAVLVCDPGSIMKDDKCVLCPSGSYYRNDTCVDCPVGEYQELEGQMECLACPPDSSTEEVRCRNETDCKRLCKPGTYSVSGLETCISCPVATYQNKRGETSCEPCRNGTTTSTYGASDSNDCQEMCGPGTHSQNSLHPCEPCPRGYYQSLNGQTECLECQGNLTTITTGASSESECVDFDPCSTVDCQHEGQCVRLRHEVHCLCKKGFQGAFCEDDVDECLDVPCFNNGTCTNLEGTFECSCTSGFTGFACDKEIDECQSSPCLNNGVCVDQIANYTCICRPGYSGVNCELKVDPCFNGDFCLNGGTCKDVDDTPFCVCSEGFTGVNCQTNINDCEGVLCKNGGSCIDGISNYSCACARGWAGSFCDLNIDECQAHDCTEGSTCLNFIGEYRCLCPPGWSGSRCENKLNSDFVMSFPDVTVANMAKVTISDSLSEASVSMWVQTNDVVRSGTPLSYAALAHVGENMDNAMTFSDCSGLQIYVNNEPLHTEVDVADGKWHHVAFTWSSQDSGRWNLYKDGQLASQGQGLQSGNPIPGNGVLVLGQEQDDLGGGFSPLETFTGNITRVNVWSRTLSSHNVSQLCNLDDDLPGKVVAWPDFLASVSDDVHILQNENPILS